MGQSTFPAPLVGATYSSQPPAVASSVLLDGQLVNNFSYTTYIPTTGAPILVYGNGGNGVSVNIGGIYYPGTSGSTVGTGALGGSQYATIQPTALITTMPNAGYWPGIAYGNSLFVAVSNTSSNVYAYSSDGKTWTSGTFPASKSMRSIVYGNGYFVACGSNYTVFTSTNGTTWSSYNGTINYTPNVVGYGNVSGTTPTFVMAYYYTNVGNYSTNNGASWTACTLPATDYWLGCDFGGGYFVMTTGGVTGTNNIYSSNGTTWTLGGAYPTAGQFRRVSYGNGVFVTVDGSNLGLSMYSSNNGVSWTSGTMPANSYQSLCFTGSIFVSVSNGGSYTNAGAWSTNGSTWTAFSIPSSAGYVDVRQCWYGNNGIIFTGNSTSAYYMSTAPLTFGIYNGPTTTH